MLYRLLKLAGNPETALEGNPSCWRSYCPVGNRSEGWFQRLEIPVSQNSIAPAPNVGFCQFAVRLILVGAISRDVEPLHSKRRLVLSGNAKNAGKVDHGYVFPTSRNYFPVFCSKSL